MSLKEKVEQNLTLSVLALLFAGFVAGFSAYHGLLTITHAERVSDGGVSAKPPSENAELLRSQLDQLLTAHTKRVEELQARLLEYESEATNTAHIDSSQRDYAESAKRLSQQIAVRMN
jgi:hypothetical protein